MFIYVKHEKSFIILGLTIPRHCISTAVPNCSVHSVSIRVLLSDVVPCHST